MLASFTTGVTSVISGTARFDRPVVLAWRDIKLRYRRTKLGPFWMTLNSAVMILSVGLVWGFIFHIPMREYLPYFAVGIIVWNFISLTLQEGCQIFVDSHHLIKSVPNPMILYVWRSMARQVICLAHNVLFIAMLWLVTARPLDLGAMAAIPGLMLLIVTLFGSILLLSILCARYRDVPQFVISLLQVMFLVTPIIWSAKRLGGQLPSILIYGNPLFNLIEVIRAPLLGYPTSQANWIIASITSAIMLLIGITFYGRFAKRIPYWL